MARGQILDEVLEISQDYLGPAAERFLDRQILTHLKKSPEKLTENDLKSLIDWLKLSLALLTENTGLVEDYVQRLTLVANGRSEEALGAKWTHR